MLTAPHAEAATWNAAKVEQSVAQVPVLLVGMKEEVLRDLASLSGLRVVELPARYSIESDEIAIVVFDGRREEQLRDVELAARAWAKVGAAVLVAYWPPPGRRSAIENTGQLCQLARQWGACVVECRGSSEADGIADAVRAVHDSLYEPGLIGFDVADLRTAIAAPSVARFHAARYRAGARAWSVPDEIRDELASAERVFMVIRRVDDTSLFDINAIFCAVADATDAATIIVSSPRGREPVVSLLTLVAVAS